jgi:hypothetical protein
MCCIDAASIGFRVSRSKHQLWFRPNRKSLERAQTDAIDPQRKSDGSKARRGSYPGEYLPRKSFTGAAVPDPSRHFAVIS